MYSQFFGNYLLSKQAVTTDQLVHAIQEQHTKHLRLGTLAMHAGLLTALQVDNVVIRQTHEGRAFNRGTGGGTFKYPDTGLPLNWTDLSGRRRIYQYRFG